MRRLLIEKGEKHKAGLIEKVLDGQSLGVEPFSPRTTWARNVVSGRSSNQSLDDYKFGKQHKKQVLAPPDLVDIEKFTINQKNVSFVLRHKEDKIEYRAPTRPQKPYLQSNWKQLNREIKSLHWKKYKDDLKRYKEILRPSRIEPPSSLPESLKANFFAVGNPYANILAFSIYDIREDLLDSLGEHQCLVGDDGMVLVEVLGSDGCDGAAGYGMMSKASDRDIPDHALAYDFGITQIIAKNTKGDFL